MWPIANKNKQERINPLGMNIPILYIDTPTLVNIYIPILKVVGIRYIRFEMLCTNQEPSNGTFVFTNNDEDNKVSALINNGFKIIALLDQYVMPSWMSTGGQFYPPTPSQYQAWCQAVSSHYAGQISLFELGNEPNFQFFWNPVCNPVAYTALLKAGYNGIKSGNANAKVISAGLGQTQRTDSNEYKATDFLTSMYANGAKGYFDYLGMHPYANSDTLIYDLLTSNFSYIDSLKTIMDANGDTSHMMATEVGWSNCVPGGVTQRQAANTVINFLNDLVLGSHQYVDVFCLYTFANTGSDITNGDQNYGMLNQDLSPKLIYNSFQSMKQTYLTNFNEI